MTIIAKKQNPAEVDAPLTNKVALYIDCNDGLIKIKDSDGCINSIACLQDINNIYSCIDNYIQNVELDVFLIGGGGGGGYGSTGRIGGGGGSGGLVCCTYYIPYKGKHCVKIGQGGIGGTSGYGGGGGGITCFDNMIAYGGGGGGNYGNNGGNGGSGGGGGQSKSVGQPIQCDFLGGKEGYEGGNVGGCACAGGGGGICSKGQDYSSDGGSGICLNIDGTDVCIGRGGNGGANTTVDGYGNGGGGGGSCNAGINGKSGIAIFKYLLSCGYCVEGGDCIWCNDGYKFHAFTSNGTLCIN